ncbi:MAG: TldD/PmbA family protein [Candidatus Bathyarchaeota archaeon]|nr:TldD/PmbA family protein [Candidatus Bathyarchaeota archaeon]
MKDIMEYCLDYAQILGASYVDVRGEHYYNEFISVVNAGVDKSFTVRKNGVGVRALVDGAWGFSSLNHPTKESVKTTVENAVSQAKMISRSIKEPVTLAPVKVYKDKVATPRKLDVEDVAFDDKIKNTLEWEQGFKVSDEVKETMLNYTAIKFDRTFMSSEGADIEFNNSVLWLEMKTSATRGGKRGAFALYHGGSGGYDFLTEGDPSELTMDVGNKAVSLIDAEYAPSMKDTTLVFDPYYQAILTHEITGHPSEADRVLGREAASAGSAWWAGKIGEHIGSEYLNIYDDPTLPGTCGYFPYDDEGVKAKTKVLAKEGILIDHMHSRETASIFNVEPNAGMRAMTFEYVPLIRMSNTFIGGGDWKPEEIIEDTKKGVYVSTRKDNSIDDMRYNWTISAQEGWMIEDGELTTHLKDVTVNGIAPKLFTSIDAVGNDLSIKPLIGCGKGMQMLYTGNGGPTMRGVADIVGG